MYDRNDPTDNWKIAKRKEIRCGRILVFGEEKKNEHTKTEKKNDKIIIVDKCDITFDFYV